MNKDSWLVIPESGLGGKGTAGRRAWRDTMPEANNSIPLVPKKPLGVMLVLLILLAFPVYLVKYEIADVLWGEPKIVDLADNYNLYKSGELLVARMFIFLLIGRIFYQIPRLAKPWMWFESAAFAIFSILALSSIVLFYARVYRDYGLKDGDCVVHDGITSLYFSIVTWATIGYGDVTPTPPIRLFAASEGVVGYVGMAALIVVIARLMAKTDLVKEFSPPAA